MAHNESLEIDRFNLDLEGYFSFAYIEWHWQILSYTLAPSATQSAVAFKLFLHPSLHPQGRQVESVSSFNCSFNDLNDGTFCCRQEVRPHHWCWHRRYRGCVGFHRAGYLVFCGARNPSAILPLLRPGMLPLQLDVTSTDSIEAAV